MQHICGEDVSSAAVDEWTGIKLEPYTLEVKPNIPAFLKARARPIREALYRDAKSKEPNVQKCLKRAVATVVAE